MTEYTDNYGLNKYSDGDAANLRDQYNSSMDIIDNQLHSTNTNVGNANALSQKNSANIISIQKILSSLGAGDAESAGAIKSTVDRMNRKIVVFGDSWTQYQNRKIPETVAMALHAEIVGNYGVNGAGFGDLRMQVNNAKTLLTEDQKNEVTDVLVIMGINTFVNSKDFDYGTAYTTSSDIIVTFPNARYHFAPSSGAKKYVSDSFDRWRFIFGAFNGYTMNFGMIWIPFMFKLFDQTLYHLSEIGCDIYGRLIAAQMNGALNLNGGRLYNDYFNITVMSDSEIPDATISDLNVFCDNGSIRLLFTMSNITGATSSTPKRMRLAFEGDQILATDSIPNQLGVAGLVGHDLVLAAYYKDSSNKVIEFKANNPTVIVDLPLALC